MGGGKWKYLVVAVLAGAAGGIPLEDALLTWLLGLGSGDDVTFLARGFAHCVGLWSAMAVCIAVTNWLERRNRREPGQSDR